MDIDNIPPGTDFMELVSQAIASCDALIAVIGEEWLTCPDDDGSRRLDHPGDFVRLEIEAALRARTALLLAGEGLQRLSGGRDDPPHRGHDRPGRGRLLPRRDRSLGEALAAEPA